MSSPKKGSKSPARPPARPRKDKVPHVIDYEPESPVIRQQEAETARRKGYRNALWLIVAIVVVSARLSGDGRRADNTRQPPPEAPLDIARRRYASGELSQEEFEQIRRDLS